MKKLFAVVLMTIAVSLQGFSQDYLRLGERTIMGTARYVGMSGAMSAIGGDPSAVLDNPAGLGLYRRPEVMLSFDVMLDRTRQNATGLKGRSNLFMAPHASFVFSFPTANTSGSGIQAHNIMFSYNRVQSYSRLFYASATNSPSLGNLLASTGVDMKIPYCTERTNAANDILLRESGYVNKYAIDWAMNISNRWYWGIGLRIHSFSFGNDAEYYESFVTTNAANVRYSNLNRTSLLYHGGGVGLATGLIYRPLSWLRLGFAIETPSIGSLRINSSGRLDAQTDSLRTCYAPDNVAPLGDFHMPLHISTSVAFQVSYYALIAFQYDYRKQPGELQNHSLRAGFEVIPVSGLYINGGYAFEGAFSKKFSPVAVDPELIRRDTYSQRLRWSQYASVGLGYRGRYFMIHAAYQFRWQRVNLYAHENVLEPYDINTNTHRIVLTIGWHRN